MTEEDAEVTMNIPVTGYYVVVGRIPTPMTSISWCHVTLHGKGDAAGITKVTN